MVSASIFPAWRSCRLSIIEVLNRVENIKSKPLVIRGVIGTIICLIGGLCIYWMTTVVGRQSETQSFLLSSGYMTILTLFLSIFFICSGIILLSPLIAHCIARLISFVSSKFRLTSLLIACRNIIRQPRRLSTASRPIFILVVLVTTISVFSNTVRVSLINFVDGNIQTDWGVLVNSEGYDNRNYAGLNKIPKEIADQLDDNPKFSNIYTYRYLENAVSVSVDDQDLSKHNLSGVNPERYLAGDIVIERDRYKIDNLMAGQILITGQVIDYLDEEGDLPTPVAVGDQIKVTYQQTNTFKVYTVGGFVNPDLFGTQFGDLILSHQFYENYIPESSRQHYVFIEAKVAKGVTNESAKQEFRQYFIDPPFSNL